MSSRTKIPFLIGSLTTFFLKRHIQRSDWLPSSIWSAFTTARCCLGLISAAKMAQITSIYRISILTTTSARFHVTSLPFFLTLPRAACLPVPRGAVRVRGLPKVLFSFIFSIKISQLVSKIRCHDFLFAFFNLFRLFFLKLTVHLHTHPHFFANW